MINLITIHMLFMQMDNKVEVDLFPTEEKKLHCMKM